MTTKSFKILLLSEILTLYPILIVPRLVSRYSNFSF